MKEKIHPNYHENVLVHCACGETFRTRSTQKEIRVEICSKCHPFFTGKQKLVDSAGRVERFNTRYAKAGRGCRRRRAPRRRRPPPRRREGAAGGARLSAPAPERRSRERSDPPGRLFEQLRGAREPGTRS